MCKFVFLSHIYSAEIWVLNVTSKDIKKIKWHFLSLGNLTETDMKTKNCSTVWQCQQKQSWGIILSPKEGKTSQFCIGGRVIKKGSKKGRQCLTMILKVELKKKKVSQMDWGKQERRVPPEKGMACIKVPRPKQHSQFQEMHTGHQTD